MVGTGQTLAGGDKVQRHVQRGPKGSVRCLLTHSRWYELFAICKLQEGQKLKGFSLLFATYVALFGGTLAGILPGGAHQERQAALFWLPTQNQHSWHALLHGSPALKGREEAGDLILWAPAFHPLEKPDIFASCHDCRQAECIGSFGGCSPTPTKLIAKGHVYLAGVGRPELPLLLCELWVRSTGCAVPGLDVAWLCYPGTVLDSLCWIPAALYLRQAKSGQNLNPSWVSPPSTIWT